MPIIITFEGIDGTGKGTQMESLSKVLSSQGLRVAKVSFPVYSSFFGTQVGKYLTGAEGVRADTVDSKSMALWFALDRYEFFKDFDLTACDILLLNRYVLSNAVYQSIREIDTGKGDILDFVNELEYVHFGIPKPDRILVFDMDLASASSNVSKKGYRDYVGDGKDIYESIPDLQRRARDKYLEYASRLDNVSVIQCMENGKLKSIDAISDLVQDSLSDLIPQIQ